MNKNNQRFQSRKVKVAQCIGEIFTVPVFTVYLLHILMQFVGF